MKKILNTAKRVKACQYAVVPWLIDVLGGLMPEKLANKQLLYTTEKHISKLLPDQLK